MNLKLQDLFWHGAYPIKSCRKVKGLTIITMKIIKQILSADYRGLEGVHLPLVTPQPHPPTSRRHHGGPRSLLDASGAPRHGGVAPPEGLRGAGGPPGASGGMDGGGALDLDDGGDASG